MSRPRRKTTVRRIARRRRGFAQLGSVDLAPLLGISPARARELRLVVAWRHVAGETLARRAPVIALRRGTLEVLVSEWRWMATLRELLPRLAARMALRYPELGIRACKLIDDSGASVRLELEFERESERSAAAAAADDTVKSRTARAAAPRLGPR